MRDILIAGQRKKTQQRNSDYLPKNVNCANNWFINSNHGSQKNNGNIFPKWSHKITINPELYAQRVIYEKEKEKEKTTQSLFGQV